MILYRVHEQAKGRRSITCVPGLPPLILHFALLTPCSLCSVKNVTTYTKAYKNVCKVKFLCKYEHSAMVPPNLTVIQLYLFEMKYLLFENHFCKIVAIKKLLCPITSDFYSQIN